MIGNKELPEYKNKYEDKIQPLATPRTRGRPKKSEVGIAKPTAKKRGRPSNAEKEEKKQKAKNSKNIALKILGQPTIKTEMDYIFEEQEENIENEENLNISISEEFPEEKKLDIEKYKYDNYYDEEKSKNPNNMHKKIGYLTILIIIFMVILIISQVLTK